MIFEDLEFLPMTREDIPVLTPIMKASFDDDARLHFLTPTGGPEGYDDGSFLEKWGLNAGAQSFRINLSGRAIGAIVLFINPQYQAGHLGCLFIDPAFIGKGYGTMAWRFAEHAYPQIRLWTTETPAASFRNHCFYINKCGFHVVAVADGRDRYTAQFKLRKELSDAKHR